MTSLQYPLPQHCNILSDNSLTIRPICVRISRPLHLVEQVERGLGDDQSPRGMWGDLDPWLASLWQSLLQLKPLPEGAVVDDAPRLEPPLFAMTSVTVDDNTTRLSTLDEEAARGREAFWNSMAPPRRKGHGGGFPRSARLLINRRLTAEGHFQDVRHLEFDVADVPGGADYAAGDVAWVHPSNNECAVKGLSVTLGLNLDRFVRIAPAVSTAEPSYAVTENGTATTEDRRESRQQQTPFFLPPVCTLRALLSDVLDISGTPRRSFFERLSLFAADKEEKDKLEELASPGGADLLYEYATREKRSYVEVFGDFPSCKVPPERLLELVPRLRPRGFSIASSTLETPSTVHLCMAVVSFR